MEKGGWLNQERLDWATKGGIIHSLQGPPLQPHRVRTTAAMRKRVEPLEGQL